MKLSLQKLRHLNGEALRVDEMEDIREIKELNNDIRSVEPVHVVGTVRMNGDKIFCQLQVTGKMILPCARTLIDVPYSFEVHVDETYTTDEFKESEEIHLVKGELLDLTPAIRENVLLDVPMRVFAEKEELEANTVDEGEGWTLITDEQKEKKVDPRLEKLQQFFEKNKEDN
ncbi:uncharacterized protein GGQ92_000109 [Gracilibacillus halotolerans]|uniref:DUF177 domain-containing protein n=1 Tax=Gracilibacillus halotolerans TaxID=74386 RepID=A0A841RH23_9BACI|nr:YceD family protein [Gracilibacillus halotolerans]MBB6511342.1 uncharacterized protein [Gracilibacillus halotolerans]